MKKNLLVLLSVLVVASLALAACGGATEAPKAGTELTIWHSYHTGENEEKAINQVVELYKAENPDVTVNVLAVPFDQIANKWSTEVAAGGGPDMFTMPNDDLGNWIRGGLVAPVDEYVAGKLDGFSQLSIDGVTYEGKMYAVPGIAKAVGLFYNKAMVPEPPKTTDELLQMVKDGNKLVMRPAAYHNFGFLTGTFGGILMDDTGKCVADQGGFAEGLQYFKDLKAAGAVFETDEQKANTMFQQGEAAFIVSGPWMLGAFSDSLGEDLGIAPLPAGPGGAATPLTGIDGWYLNPNSPNKEAAVNLALFIFGQKGAQIYTDVAKDPMARTDITAADPMIGTFADIAAQGFPRPQSTEFGNWWGAFGDAITKVLEGQAEPAAAVSEACATMNTANNK